MSIFWLIFCFWFFVWIWHCCHLCVTRGRVQPFISCRRSLLFFFFFKIRGYDISLRYCPKKFEISCPSECLCSLFDPTWEDSLYTLRDWTWFTDVVPLISILSPDYLPDWIRIAIFNHLISSTLGRLLTCKNWWRLLCCFIVNDLLIWAKKHHWEAVDWCWRIVHMFESEVLLVLAMPEKCSLWLCAI